MNRLSTEERAKIIGCLVKSNSMRATGRMTGAAKKTVERLLREVGAACAEYHDKNMRNVNAKRVKCDEAWSFCYSKQANVPEQYKGMFGFGDVWTWMAMDADSKLVISYRVDRRDEDAAYNFIHDLAMRLANRIQLSTDGLRVYINAVEYAFGGDIDYGMLKKIYSAPHAKEDARRNSPDECCGARKRKIIGTPDRKHISTSHIERQNLKLRMHSRRFTRLTNAFSKKVENLSHAVALHFMYYNFCRVHQTL